MDDVHAHPFVMRFGHVLLSIVFLVAGLGRLADLDGGADVIAAVIEVGLGTMLLFGFRPRQVAIGLAMYLVIVTLSLHDFWTLSGAEAAVQRDLFVKNLAIIGGLLMVYADALVRVRIHEHHPPGAFREGEAIRLP